MFDSQGSWSVPWARSSLCIDVAWTSRCGTPMRWRSVGAGDAAALEAMLLRQSRASRYQRFHSAVNGFTPKQLARLTCDDDPLQHGLVLTTDSGGTRGIILAEARFASEDGCSAEVAVMVDEAWRRRGIGWCALGMLAGAAQRCGLLALHGRVLDSNEPMLGLARRAGWALVRDADDARVRCFRLDLALTPGAGAGFNAPAFPQATVSPGTNRVAPCVR